MPIYRNIHGRRGTRGIRPWLIAPKLLAVAIYFGSLTSAALIWTTSRWHTLPLTDPNRLAVVSSVSSLFHYLIIPSLVLAIAIGLALLLLQSPQILLRLRWLQIKLLLLLLFIPSAHLFMSARFDALRHAAQTDQPARAAAIQTTAGFAITLILSAIIILIARIKPRLRQNWAKAFVRRSKTTPENHP